MCCYIQYLNITIIITSITIQTVLILRALGKNPTKSRNEEIKQWLRPTKWLLGSSALEEASGCSEIHKIPQWTVDKHSHEVEEKVIISDEFLGIVLSVFLLFSSFMFLHFYKLTEGILHGLISLFPLILCQRSKYGKSISLVKIYTSENFCLKQSFRRISV